MSTILEILFLPFLNIFHTTGRLSWIYLMSALLIGFFAIVHSQWKHGTLTGKNLLKNSFDFSHWKHPSSVTDFIYYFIETILYTLVLSYFVVTTLTVSIFTFTTLRVFFGDFHLTENAIIKILYTFLFLGAYDFGRFFIHKLMHRSPSLWEFHKFHHSAKTLTPFTVYRIHPIESILLNSMSGICTGIVTGVFVMFFPTISMFTFLEVNFGLFLFHLYSNLRHTQVWLNFPAWLSYILLSPAQHQIHHSRDPKHMDKNLGAIFGFWDYLNGTLYIPKKKENLIYGLPAESNPKDFTNIFRIFFLPFKKVALLLNRKS
jgi:sterol desaturase/sphingolipid hydroxylase (fatty acid hydroxylase superfamily)